MFRRFFSDKNKASKILTAAQPANVSLEDVREAIKDHRIWCDQVIALITSFMSNDDYSDCITASFIDSTEYNKCIAALILFDNEVKEKIQLMRDTANQHLEKIYNYYNAVPIGDKPVANNETILKKFEKDAALENFKADELEKLETYSSLLEKYSSLSKIPDIILLKHKSHYSAATSNRDAIGILANYCVDYKNKMIEKKPEKTPEERCLLKLIKVYELINHLAAIGQRIDSDTENLMIVSEANMIKEGFQVPKEQKLKSEEAYFEFIKQYMHIASICLAEVKELADENIQAISQNPLVKLEELEELEERPNTRMNLVLDEAREGLNKIESLINRNKALSAYCYGDRDKDEDEIARAKKSAGFSRSKPL